MGLVCDSISLFCALDGAVDAGFVEGLKDIVDGVNVKGLNGVMVEGGSEDNVRDFKFALHEFLEDAEAIESGHLDVEKDEVGVVFLDEVEGFDAIFAVAEDVNLREGFSGGTRVRRERAFRRRR